MQQGLNKLLKEQILLVIAIAVTLFVYSKFLFFGHISWDDPEMVFKNKAVKDFNLAVLFSNHYVGNYTPVTMLLHAIGWSLFGSGDWGHHLLSILLHVVNGILVFRTGKKLFKQDLAAITGAVIFLLHPLQVESVGWISELKNVLSSTFYLWAILSYLRFTENKKTGAYLLTLLLFILGCLSKSSVVVLPLIFIAIDLFLLKDTSRGSLLNKLPFIALSVVFGLINIRTQTADLFINHSHEFAWPQRFGMAGFALIKYLLLFIAPASLSVIYPYPALKTATVILGIVAWLGLITGIVLLARNKKTEWIFLIVFVVINLLLVLQLLPFGEALYADRYAYIPLIGFAWMLGLFIIRLKLPATITILVLTGILALFTFLRADKWKTTLGLYEDILKKYPGQFVALNSAGVESMFVNEDDKALNYLNDAVKVSPNNYKGYYNRGLLLLKNNQPKQAVKSFNQSLAIYEYPKAYVGRASAYLMMGDLPKAMSDAGYVLNTDNNNVKAHFVMGNCYNELNKLDEALKEYNKCIELNNEEADYYFKRAIVYGKKQDFKMSLGDLELCTSLNSELYEAYYWKGVAKVNLQQDPCADLRLAAQKNFEPAINAYYKYCK